MAVLPDSDGLGLWVEPHEWTDEPRDEVKRFIEERRRRETDPTFSEKAAEILSKIRASSASVRSLVGKAEGGPDARTTIKE